LPTAERVTVTDVRTSFTDQLGDLTGSLAALCGLTEVAMQRATQALLETDLTLAEQVIGEKVHVDELAARCEERAFTILALQAPVAKDLRIVVSTVHLVADMVRMSELALHVAKIVRRRHPAPVLPEQVRGCFADMGAVAANLAAAAAEVLLTRDPERAAQLEAEDDVMDELHVGLSRLLLDSAWSSGVIAAVDVTLLGRYYERYADHAVEVARRVVFLATGTLPGGPSHER